jgi:hypothetical protein
MYMTSGKYRKSSSQSINECAFGDGCQLNSVDRDNHVDDEGHATQGGKQPDDEQATANELHRRNEIRRDVRKGNSGTDDRFVHELVLTGDGKACFLRR